MADKINLISDKTVAQISAIISGNAFTDEQVLIVNEGERNKIGITVTDSPYTAQPYDSISASCAGGSIVIDFDPGNVGEHIYFDELIQIGSNNVTFNSANGFRFVMPDGDILIDNSLDMTTNTKLKFSWDGALHNVIVL